MIVVMGTPIRLIGPRKAIPPIEAFGVPGAGLLSFVFSQLQNQLGSLLGSWVNGIPWLWIALGILIFWVGQLSADWANARSWLRQWWYQRIALFDLVHVVPAHFIEDNEAQFRITAKVRFRVTSDRSHCVMVAHYTNNRNQMSVELWKGEAVLAGAERDIVLATIPAAFERNGTFPNGKSVLAGAHYLLEVRIISGRRTQAFLARMDIFQKGAGTSGRFWLSDEADLFSTKPWGPVPATWG